jgi:membrane associated rhomboid family serine protease
MGIHDRPYMKDGETEHMGSGLTVGLPPIARVVKYLLIVNLVVFVLQVFTNDIGQGRLGFMSLHFGANVAGWYEPWRYVTFQFLHGDYWHIIMNMLGLYLLGSPLEQHWGPRRFLAFYLACGAFSGLTYVAASAAVGDNRFMPIIGASGGIFAILLACAVLFPQFKLILVFFPVPIRLAALLIFGGMIFMVLNSLRQGAQGSDFWSDTCHLGGAAAAAFYLWVLPAFGGIRLRRTFRRGPRAGSGAWKRRMDKMAAEQEQIDRILQKIHEHGVASLTRKEQKTLKDATKRQQARERELYK